MVDGKSDSQDFQRLTSAMEVLGIKVRCSRGQGDKGAPNMWAVFQAKRSLNSTESKTLPPVPHTNVACQI